MSAMGRFGRTLQRRTVFFAEGGDLRPPWTDEARVRSACTSCGDCLRACPETILVPGPAGTPMVDFNRGECTFCGACADVCAAQVFDDTATQPWNMVAEVQPACLLAAGISCRSCTDACDSGALRFDLRRGSVGAIDVLTDACTGCGACVGTCPMGAIAFRVAVEPSLTPKTETAV